MDDLIDRQAAIDAVVAWTVEDRPDIEMPTDLVGRIKALPSAQPEQQWTLCRDKMPDEPGLYLTIRFDFAERYEVLRYSFSDGLFSDGFCRYSDEDGAYYPVPVYAWMPIEPWRGEEHETD